MPETSTQPGGPSLEQILWRAMERFREEPALLDAEEFAEHIAHGFDADVCEEKFSDRFFAGVDTLRQERHTLAEAVVWSAKQRLHVYEFDLDRLEYVIVEDKERLVVVSDFGQFQLPNDDAVGRALEAAVVKVPERRGGEPRGYFVRASGEVVGIDVKKVARTLERLMVRQVSMPAVNAPAARLAPFNPVRKALSESREQLALRQDPRLSRLLPAAPVAGRGPDSAGAEPRQTALFVVMPDGSLARAEIGSATRWERMLGQYARAAAQQVAIQTGNVLAIVRGGQQDSAGERAERRGEALAAVRETAAPVRALAGDDLARALTDGGRVVPAVEQGDRFWVQPEQAFRPELPLSGKTAIAEPLQLGEVTGDPWADWALMVGKARMRLRPAGEASRELPPAAMLAERVRRIGPVPVQIAGGPVVAFRAPDGSIIVNRETGPVRLAAVDRQEPVGRPATPIAIRDVPELVPRTGAVPVAALQSLELALERTAAAAGYRLPLVRIDSRPDAIEVGDALELAPLDSRRRSVRLAGPVTAADRTAQLVLSMPFPNRGELHVGEDLSDALQAWVAGPVLPAQAAALTLGVRQTVAASGREPAFTATALDWGALHEQATQSAQQGAVTLDLPVVRSLATGDPAISDLPLLLRHAVAGSGDWTAGPGAPLPLAVRDFAFRTPFVASVETLPTTALRTSPRAPSPGEEEIVIPLPLWAQMGRGALTETNRIMASPSAPRGHASPLGLYRLVVPGGGPLDLAAGAAATAGAVEISGPTGLRLESVASSAVRAATAGGRHFLGRVPLDDGTAGASGRRRFRVGAPLQVPEIVASPADPQQAQPSSPPFLAAGSGSESASSDARTEAGVPRSAKPLSARAVPYADATPVVVSGGLQPPPPQTAGLRPFEAAGKGPTTDLRPARTVPAVRGATPPSDTQASPALHSSGTVARTPADSVASISTSTSLPLPRGLEPGMWSGHRPATTDRYRRWTYASWNRDAPQDVGGVPLSGLSRRQHPQLPVALRFRYAGAPLWWSSGAPAPADDASAHATRAMQAGLRAANSAAAIWRSILVASAPADDATGGMDAGRESSAERMSSLARLFEAIPAPLASATPPAPASTAAPAYIAMTSAGAAGAVSPTAAAASRSRAQAVEMSIVAAIPPAPPPLESMSSATRGAEAPHARGRGHSQDAAHGHQKEADDAVSHSKIEGSVDAIAQRIYHRIRRRIESDRERFGG